MLRSIHLLFCNALKFHQFVILGQIFGKMHTHYWYQKEDLLLLHFQKHLTKEMKTYLMNNILNGMVSIDHDMSLGIVHKLRSRWGGTPHVVDYGKIGGPPPHVVDYVGGGSPPPTT